ncbi:hypothetical protein ACIGEI_08590, partial [Pseudomonas sp. NPDC078863]
MKLKRLMAAMTFVSA